MKPGHRCNALPLWAWAISWALVLLLLAACGGGSSSPGSGDCERVSGGSSNLTVRNELTTGMRAFLPQFAFGADMAAGECNVIGLEYPNATLAVRVDATQCGNSVDNTDCAGKLFGTTRSFTIALPRGGSGALTITAASFATAPPGGSVQLLTNGSFEAPAIGDGVLHRLTPTSWTVGAAMLNPNEAGGLSGNVFTWPQPADGQQYANIGNTVATVLSQVFTVAATGPHRIEWQDNTGLNIAPGFQTAPCRVRLVNAAGQVVYTADRNAYHAHGCWASVVVTTTLAAGSHTLSFTSLNSANQTNSLIHAVSGLSLP